MQHVCTPSGPVSNQITEQTGLHHGAAPWHALLMKPAPPKAVSYGCRPACHTYHWIHAPHEHRTLTQDEVDIHLPSCRATLSVSHALYPGIQAVPPRIHKTVKQSAGTLHCHCSVPKKELHGWQARNSQVSAQSCNTGTAAPSCTGVSPTSPKAKVQEYCPTACYHHHLTTNQLTTQATLQLRPSSLADLPHPCT